MEQAGALHPIHQNAMRRLQMERDAFQEECRLLKAARLEQEKILHRVRLAAAADPIDKAALDKAIADLFETFSDGL